MALSLSYLPAALNSSGHSCYAPILLLTSQILSSSGNPEFFCPTHLKYCSQQNLILQSLTFFILNFLLVILNAITTSPITWVLAISNYEEYVFTGKSSTYTKVWQSHSLPYPAKSVSSLYSTRLYYPPCQTSPSFHLEWRPPNLVAYTFKRSLCSCSFYMFHALTLPPVFTPSVCLSCSNKML